MGQAVIFELKAGASSVGEIQTCIDNLMSQLRADPTLLDAELDPADLAQAEATLREDGRGLDPFLTAVIVTIVSELTIEGSKALWNRWLLPGIRKQLGVNALGEEVSTTASDSEGVDRSDGADSAE